MPLSGVRVNVWLPGVVIEMDWTPASALTSNCCWKSKGLVFPLVAYCFCLYCRLSDLRVDCNAGRQSHAEDRQHDGDAEDDC